MSLCDALRIRAGDVVSFVGAGGKTTACMRVAMELAGRDLRVMLTTTTKIFEPITSPDERLILADSLPLLLESISRQFEEASVVIAARRRLDDPPANMRWMGNDYPIALRPRKLEGLLPEWIDELAARRFADVILVEADGASHRLVKAPASHEPVIPRSSTVVVPMADTEALGKGITEEYVHRPALLADLAGVSMGHAISPEILAVAVGHPEGGLKDVPPAARVIPLLTCRSLPERCVATQKTVRLLLLSPRIDHVVLAQLRGDPVRWEVYSR